MALSTLRFRRAFCIVSGIAKQQQLSTVPCLNSNISSSPLSSSSSICRNYVRPHSPADVRIPSASFHTARHLLISSRFTEDDGKISPDTILFEGCDYKHWLITMDFPKDPKPTPEEMVETYVQTCAKGLGCSIEEAKKKIYACSTTTYQGFQAEMTEEESEKFRGLPGVVFILPDSYIDPVNKEYGGDKYINGTIIPRPPPVQYGSMRRRDRSPRYDRPSRDSMHQQGTSTYSRQGPMQGDGRNYVQQPNYVPPVHDIPPNSMQGGGGRNYVPQQNYGPSGQDVRQGYAPQQNYGPPGPGAMPGDGRGYAPQPNYGPPGQGPMQGDGRSYNYGPLGQGPLQGDGMRCTPQQNYGPSQIDGVGHGPLGGRDFYQGERRDPSPVAYGGHSSIGYQGERRDTFSPQREYNQGGQANYTPSAGGAGYRQAYGAAGGGQQLTGNYGQSVTPGYSPGSGGDYGQGGGPRHEQNYSGPIEGQGFSQTHHGSGMPEQGNYGPLGQSGSGQGQ